jgi:hypothetical protein
MRPAVRSFDRFLARAVGVIEFTQDPGCILRVQQATLRRPLALPGVEARPGEPVLMLHLWNTRVPALPAEGADVAWARRITRALVISLHLVSGHILQQPPDLTPRAIGAITVLGLASGTADVLSHLGFLARPYASPLGRLGEWWENAYTWSLMWAYNPASLRGKRLRRLRRCEYWMSTPAFLQRFPSP